jgi:hypothetical protein
MAGFTSLGLVALLFFTNLHPLSLSIFAVCMVALFAVDRGIIPVMDSQKKWEGYAIQGAEGEEVVGAILDRVPNIRVAGGQVSDESGGAWPARIPAMVAGSAG